jgi:site-specific DNA recombinase
LQDRPNGRSDHLPQNRPTRCQRPKARFWRQHVRRPQGVVWQGHSKKGAGLYNNSTYIGWPKWGRQRFIKDPKSGRRDALWQAVKQRQDEVSRPTSDLHFTNPLNETHRPRFLLSGLLTCGVCGGGCTITAKDRYGCARRGRQGTCSNSRGIKRQELESRVLDGLRTSLVTPDIVASFVDDYRIAWNKLQSERRAEANQRGRKLAEVTRKISSVMDAIERGILTPTTKDRLLALEAEKAELERMTVEPAMPAIHPNLAQHYRDLVQRLQDQLEQPELAASAKTMLRALIEEIRITPGAKRGECCLELVGKLAAILNISQGTKNKGGTLGSGIQASVVAGARNGYYSTGLVCGSLCDCLDLVFGASHSKLLNSPPKTNPASSTRWVTALPIFGVYNAIPCPKFPATKRPDRSANARSASIQSHVPYQHREVAPTAA